MSSTTEHLMSGVQAQTNLEVQSSAFVLPIVEPSNKHAAGKDNLMNSALPGAPFATLWYFNLKSKGNAIRQLNLGGQVVGNGGVNRNSAVYATVTEVDFNGTLIGDANLAVTNVAPTDNGQIFIRLQNSFTVRPIDVVVKILVIN